MMKTKNLLLLTVSIILTNASCIGNQKSQVEQSDTISTIQTDTIFIVQTNSLADEEAIVQMLKEFYIAHNRAWYESNDVYVLIEQLNVLQHKYCTQKFRKELKEAFEAYGLDHDIFTADYGIDNESIKTLLIIKDNVRENTYCVSYTVNTEDPTNKTISQYVEIQIVVEKEDGDFKINEVLNPFQGVCN